MEQLVFVEDLEIVALEILEEEIVIEVEEVIAIEVVMVVHSGILPIEIQIIVFKANVIAVEGMDIKR